MLSGGDGLCRRAATSSPTRRVQVFCESPVRSDTRCQNSSLTFHRPEHGCARSVAEDNASRAIRVINILRENFCADDERALRLACANQTVRHRQTVEETGTGGGNIKSSGVVCAKLCLNQAARRRKNLVGRDGRANQRINLCGVNARTLNRLARSFDGKERGVLSRRSFAVNADRKS